MSIDFSANRQSYQQDELLEANLPSTPYPLLQKWIQEAMARQIGEPYAFSLATCSPQGRPSVRTLLMREINQHDEDIQLVFYSNYDSQKACDLSANPYAQCLFFWDYLERQVRLSGTVQKIDRTKSATYFASRPKDSQLAAWVSTPQSGVVDSRDTMQQRFDELSLQFANDVPLPDFWGGYALWVESVEFWQGRANRMHDRIIYHKAADGWQNHRLLP